MSVKDVDRILPIDVLAWGAEYLRDLPHNVGRIVTKSEGYDATLVAGKVLIANGKFTGDRRGKVIRDFG